MLPECGAGWYLTLSGDGSMTEENVRRCEMQSLHVCRSTGLMMGDLGITFVERQTKFAGSNSSFGVAWLTSVS